MDKKHRGKMAAPIIITLLMIAYYIMLAVVLVRTPGITFWQKMLCVLIPLALAGTAFAVAIERMKEIRSGEEDDLSKY